jgi:hypothetical protein
MHQKRMEFSGAGKEIIAARKSVCSLDEFPHLRPIAKTGMRNVDQACAKSAALAKAHGDASPGARSNPRE